VEKKKKTERKGRGGEGGGDPSSSHYYHALRKLGVAMKRKKGTKGEGGISLLDLYREKKKKRGKGR